jgi:phenylpyruvate tautomerase PptA (4-oxalocrotonate tautomerase family)
MAFLQKKAAKKQALIAGLVNTKLRLMDKDPSRISPLTTVKLLSL